MINAHTKFWVDQPSFCSQVSRIGFDPFHQTIPVHTLVRGCEVSDRAHGMIGPFHGQYSCIRLTHDSLLQHVKTMCYMVS
jgi:hypothetical protein